jgi:hypothetical protein
VVFWFEFVTVLVGWFATCLQPPVDAALVTHDTYAINRMKEGEHRTFDPKAKYLKVGVKIPLWSSSLFTPLMLVCSLSAAYSTADC